MEYSLKLTNEFMEEFNEICKYISEVLKAPELLYVNYAIKNYLQLKYVIGRINISKVRGEKRKNAKRKR